MKKTLDWIARIGMTLLCVGSIVFFGNYQVEKHFHLLSTDMSDAIFKISLITMTAGLATAWISLKKLGYKNQLD